MKTQILKINNHTIQAEVADTFWKKAKGLMFAEEKKNILFTFSREGKYGFWMPFVRFPILICFADSKKRIIQTEKAIPVTFSPKTWKIYKPKHKIKYVLELAEDINAKEGDIIQVQR